MDRLEGAFSCNTGGIFSSSPACMRLKFGSIPPSIIETRCFSMDAWYVNLAHIRTLQSLKKAALGHRASTKQRKTAYANCTRIGEDSLSRNPDRRPGISYISCIIYQSIFEAAKIQAKRVPCTVTPYCALPWSYDGLHCRASPFASEFYPGGFLVTNH